MLSENLIFLVDTILVDSDQEFGSYERTEQELFMKIAQNKSSGAGQQSNTLKIVKDIDNFII